MSKDSVQIYQIKESLQVVYAAYCDKCTDTLDRNGDSKEFSRDLYILGWRVSNDGNLHCPKCAQLINNQ